MTIGALLFVVIRTALSGLIVIGALDRQLVVFAVMVALVATPVRGGTPAFLVILLKVRAELIVRMARAAAARRVPIVALVPILVAAALARPALGGAVAGRPGVAIAPARFLRLTIATEEWSAA